LVGAVSLGALSGVSQWLLSLPLSAAGAAQRDLLRPALFRSASDELVRAFGVGVSLAGPLLLGAIFAAIVVGLWGRLAGARLAPHSSITPLLLPWLGIALVSLCVANWLDSVPELVRAFAQSVGRLLGGLP
jgi:flagellar biosynthesis protein FliR